MYTQSFTYFSIPYPFSGRVLLAILLVMFFGLSSSCRRSGGSDDRDADGDDSDADEDGDSDFNGASDADEDVDADNGCTPLLGGECNPVALCGCDIGQWCNIMASTEGAIEACADGAGTGTHEEPCPCADGYLCFDPGICLRVCEDHDVCPERSLCDIGFQVAAGVGADPYRACSPQRAEADARIEYCVGELDACPEAGTQEAVLDSNATATWSCTVDVAERLTLNFEIWEADNAISGTNLVFDEAPSRLVPASCDAFSITVGGVVYSADECETGLPAPGNCVISIDYGGGQISGTIRCNEITGTGSDVLTTMNGTEVGASPFALRSCEIRE